MNIQRIFVATLLVAGVGVAVACGDDEEPTPTTTATSTAATPVASAPVPTSTPAAAPIITIDEPPADGTVSVPFVASGLSNTFEAALTVDVTDDTGAVLCRRHIMATSGSGTPGTWQTSIAIPPPADDTEATFRAYELSAEDGSEINIVERPITISAEHPPLFITSPACLATTAPGADLTVTGRGVVFEAAFILQLRDASGTAVAEQRGMAGGTEETDFTVTMPIPADLASGLYDLVAFNYSARDGAIENEFAVQVVVEALQP
jgi:hypothetical protein